MGIGNGDLLATLEAMLAPRGEGSRTVELARAMGISESTVRKLLHRLDEEGKLEKVNVQFYGIDDRPQTRTGWRLRAQRVEGDGETEAVSGGSEGVDGGADG